MARPSPPPRRPWSYACRVRHTVRDLVEASIAAESALAALGEEVEDEWSYVTDLEAAWRDRLGMLLGRGDDEIGPAVANAVQRAIDETGLVTDPHRAIDWMSTFPQIVLVALDETP